MSKQIKWHMSEKEFHELRDIDLKHRNDSTMSLNDVVVAFEMGKLWVEIEHTLDPNNWLAYPNVYALGIDDGYGETRIGKIPYALTDIDFHVRSALANQSFEDFKRSCEQLLEEALNMKRFEQYKTLADQSLGDWT